MPRGRPRTRSDHTSATNRVIRIMMDIRPKLPSHQSPPEIDIPMSTTNLVTAPIFASIASTIVNSCNKLEKEPKLDEEADRDPKGSMEHDVAAECNVPLQSSPLRQDKSIFTSSSSSSSPQEARQQLKPFICFYCGFQCDNHLMRHRCVPKKKRRTLSVDFENYDPRRNLHCHQTSMAATASLIPVNQMESEAAEILSIMLQSAY